MQVVQRGSGSDRFVRAGSMRVGAKILANWEVGVSSSWRPSWRGIVVDLFKIRVYAGWIARWADAG